MRQRLRLVFAQSNDAVARSAKRWIHPEDGLLRIARYYGTGEKELFSQEYLEVVLNPKLDPQIFDFVVPSGVHVMDMTDDVIEILNSAKETKGKESGADKAQGN